MRTETRSVQIGEYLGPVDWSFDFDSWGWDKGGCGNPELVPESKESLRLVEEGLARGERWEVHEHGGWSEVIRVGMYDGWPFWRPVPSLLLKHWLAPEWTSWFGQTGARRISSSAGAATGDEGS